jgi:beta-lactamase regulating signal transducer with metallopeptidase domain
MSNFTMNSDTLYVLWAVGAVLLVAYIMRRRKRKTL